MTIRKPATENVDTSPPEFDEGQGKKRKKRNVLHAPFNTSLYAVGMQNHKRKKPVFLDGSRIKNCVFSLKKTRFVVKQYFMKVDIFRIEIPQLFLDYKERHIVFSLPQIKYFRKLFLEINPE